MQTSRSKNKTSSKIHTNFNKKLTVFITGLSGLIKKEDLTAYLNLKCQGAISVALPNKRNAGYAFVEMDSPDSVQKILKMKNLIFNDREIQIRPFVEGKDLQRFKNEINSRRLFVSRIPKDWSDQFFTKIFCSFGKIETAYIIRKRKTKKSKGFGYIVYENKETALKIASLNELKIDEHTLLLKIHEPKHMRFQKKGSKTHTKDQEKINQNCDNQKYIESVKKPCEKINYEESYHWVTPSQSEFYLRGKNFEAFSRPEEYDLTFEATARAYDRRRKFFNVKLQLSAIHDDNSLNYEIRNSFNRCFTPTQGGNY